MIRKLSTLLILALVAAGSAYAGPQVFTDKVDGDPYTVGETFFFEIGIKANNQMPVQSFALRVHYNTDVYQLKQVEDAELGGIANSMGPVESEGPDSWQDIQTLGNIGNEKKNLNLCRLTFEVIGQPKGNESIIVEGDPDNVDIVSVGFTSIEVSYKNNQTDPLPRQPKGRRQLATEPTMTPTVTPTPVPGE